MGDVQVKNESNEKLDDFISGKSSNMTAKISLDQFKRVLDL